jgi:hypothetical protein
MKQDETINENVREFIQEWFVKPQLLDSDEDVVERGERAEGLKKVIQKGFIKYAVLNWDNLKAILEDDDDMIALHDALSKKESRQVANDVFQGAIDEAKKVIAVEFGLAPRRKLEHEILSEQLDARFGENHISNNINNLIKKNVGNGGDSDCDDGSC